MAGVCAPDREEPGPEWPLQVWSCWWLAVQVANPWAPPPAQPRYQPPPQRPALH